MTEQLEKAHLKKVARQYQTAYDNVKQQIADFVIKHFGDKEISLHEAQKFNRLRNLQRQIDAELTKITVTNVPSLAAYGADVYEFNYFYQGYVLEKSARIKLAFGQLNRDAVKASIINPLDKIAVLNGNQQLHTIVSRALTQGIVQGRSVPNMAKLIKKAMNSSAYNAQRIVRTETTRAMNQGQLASMEHAIARGLPIRKQWMATTDNRTRESHADMNGEVVDIDRPFSNGLMYPGDPAGGPEETINCRCTMVEIIEASGISPSSDIDSGLAFDDWRSTRVSG